MGFVDGDFYGLDALVTEHLGGDSGGHRLDQVVGLSTDDPGGSLGQRAVVQRRGQLIGEASRPEIQPDRRVDDELLAVRSLVFVDPMVTMYPQPGESDPVTAYAVLGAHSDPTRGATVAPSRQAAATATANT